MNQTLNRNTHGALAPVPARNSGESMNLKSRITLAALAALSLVHAPSFANEHDERIDDAFKKSYVYNTYLREDSVKAETKDGVVTLTGVVADESHKALAVETANGLPGVTRVENKLETKAQVAADNADTWIGRKAKLALLFHRNVNAGKTGIVVADGVVTLTGEASSLAQKELTGEYASDIEGVKEVKNNMTVATTPVPAEQSPGEKLDDASISAQVRTALLTHRSTSAVKTKVETRDCEVTLTGIAKNAAEKALVTKLVSDINGVTAVKNQMTVAEVAKAE